MKIKNIVVIILSILTLNICGETVFTTAGTYNKNIKVTGTYGYTVTETRSKTYNSTYYSLKEDDTPGMMYLSGELYSEIVENCPKPQYGWAGHTFTIYDDGTSDYYGYDNVSSCYVPPQCGYTTTTVLNQTVTESSTADCVVFFSGYRAFVSIYGRNLATGRVALLAQGWAYHGTAEVHLDGGPGGGMWGNFYATVSSGDSR